MWNIESAIPTPASKVVCSVNDEADATLIEPSTIFIFPCTSSLSVGFVVPMPTLAPARPTFIEVASLETSTNEPNCESSLLFAIYEVPPGVFILIIIPRYHIEQL